MVRGRKRIIALRLGLWIFSLIGSISLIVFTEPSVITGLVFLMFLSIVMFSLFAVFITRRSTVPSNKNLKAAALMTLLVDGYLLMRVFRLDSIVNVALLIASLFLLYIYFNS